MFILTDRKRCGKCKAKKPFSDFTKDKSQKDGLDCYCKECKRLHNRAVIESKRKWQKANPDKMVDATRRWKEANREYVQKRDNLYASSHREQINTKMRRWIKANAEKVNLRNRNRKARIKGNGGKINIVEWEELKKQYNYTCLCCRKVEPEIKLTLDHVLPIALGGANLIGNAQPLCMSCNRNKGAKHIDYR